MAMKNPARPRRVQEAPALLDRRRRLALAPRRPLHREARHLRPAPRQGQRGPGEDRPRARAVLARPGRPGHRPRRPLPRGRRRHREEGAREPQGRPARQGRARARQGPRRQGAPRRRRRLPLSHGDGRPPPMPPATRRVASRPVGRASSTRGRAIGFEARCAALAAAPPPRGFRDKGTAWPSAAAFRRDCAHRGGAMASPASAPSPAASASRARCG